MNNTLNWYALRVFSNRVLQMQETIRKEASSEVVQTYIAMTSQVRTSGSSGNNKASVSYSGNKLTSIPKTKRAIINASNHPHPTVTIQKPIVASLMFIRCSESFLKTLKHNHLSEFTYYTRYSDKEIAKDAITKEKEKPKKKQLQKVPAIIPDDQMQAFIWLTSENNSLQYLGEPKDIKLGDRVKVIDGSFKGLEGHVKRIKKDRKFVITIGSIAAFVIEGITHKMLKKIE
ncbi:MAG: KOW motif-containing protein [Bacteroidales bacterium]|nr:KOW motif-containing protein [Bacteroidales bacterium]